jgi:hypothetical protein
MPSRKPSFKKDWKVTDDFDLASYEYTAPDHRKHVEEALAIFGLMKLRPIAYQLGDRFYNTDNRQWFTAKNEKTLQVCMFYLGTRILWVPTIDELTQQLAQDDIRLSIVYGGKNPNRIYRTYVFDHMFEENAEVEIVRYTSNDPWIAFAVPISKAYKRRFDTYGLEYFRQPEYIHDPSVAENPEHLIDQGGEIYETTTDILTGATQE